MGIVVLGRELGIVIEVEPGIGAGTDVFYESSYGFMTGWGAAEANSDLEFENWLLSLFSFVSVIYFLI